MTYHPNDAPSSLVCTFNVLSGTEGFKRLELEWQALYDAVPQANFIQSPAWIAGYMESLADRPESMRLVTVHRGGCLVAVWPLIESSGGLLRLFRRQLRAIEHEHMSLVDLLADPRDVRVWPQLLRWLYTDRRVSFGRLLLPALCEDAVLHPWLASSSPAMMQTRELDSRSWLSTERSFEELLKAATTKHRSNYTRRHRRATEMGTLRYEVVTIAEEMPAALEQFKKIEAAGWKGREGTAVTSDPKLAEFYGNLTQRLAGQAQSEIDLLYLDNKLIASGLWFRSADAIHLQKIGYDETLSTISPGMLLLGEALKRMCANPSMRRLDFITRAPWADAWRTTQTPVWRHTIYPPTALGRWIAWQDRTLTQTKAWAKGWLARLKAMSPQSEPKAAPAGPKVTQGTGQDETLVARTTGSTLS